MLAYFDCASGISGDMFLGALVDAGLPVGELSKAINSLGISGLRLEAMKTTRLGISATKVDVIAPHEHAHRNLAEIARVIDASALRPEAKTLAVRVFSRLAAAEAKVHNCPVEQVHFHEVGALDSIADIVGAAAGLGLLGVTRCAFSAIPVGSGTVKTAHGVLPIPAPATAELLVGVPLAESVETGELTTPTGAAIVQELASSFGPLPAMTVKAVGNGAGTREGRVIPNILRLFLGEPSEDATPREVTVIETAIDDMTGEGVSYAVEALFAAGALDVYVTPVMMKKGRPGQLVTVLVADDARTRILDTLFRETTTFGARVARWRRETLDREIVNAQCEYGEFRIKLGRYRGKLVSASPEYEDAKRMAREKGVPFRQVYARLQERAATYLEGENT